ncbi:uncharacterized protein LOC110976370 [Acanthaster planci]|uniref:Uncharacterized protein LOC110976370 n=1 Tax=Acanthaster planci TaxID=133434 RepID=A0A8B7XYC9_ACAPL|nr:uncharacterized protein LOC110976370 [Acanthaster planci]XP_022085268.1 uncharacterized protein LOC110976370 [Acanthaster planci]XP_022085269.1 uncharacterized protein LOC110976370 [Acanthaster planci]
MLLEKMNGVEVHTSSVDRELKPNEKLEKEIGVLKRRLRDANDIIEDMGRRMELQKTRTRQLITGWKLRLQEGDEKVLQVAQEKDAQLTELVSELMFIEGCLKKERKEILEKLNKRDSKIRQLEQTVKKQQRQIDALNKANEKLLGSLHEIRLETPDSSPSPSPVPDSTPEEEPCVENGERPHNPHLTQFLRPEGMVPRQRASTVELLPSLRRDRRRGIPNGSILAHNNNKSHLEPDPHHQPQQHRVRFQDEVFEEGLPRKDCLDVEPVDMRIRKISLPAYRLPTDDEDSIRFF